MGWIVSPRRTKLLLSGLLILLVFTSGCVRRRLTVRTNPPGALVSVDNQVIGTTPASTSFTYYGARDVRVEHEGFQTQTVRHRMDPPWYQIPPLDFIVETLWPGEIRDERVVDIQLSPQVVEPTAAVLARADELRSQARQGVIPVTGQLATPAVAVPQPTVLSPPISAQPAPGQPVPGSPEVIPGPPAAEGLPFGGVPYQVNPN